MTTSEPMIELRDVDFRYPGQNEPALSGLSLTVAGVGTVAILGPNGAGKSTLLRMVAGGLQPARGAVRVGGAADLPALRGRTAFCPDSGGVYPFLDVRAHARFLSAQCAHWDEGRFRELAELLALPTGRAAGAWSRGQQARLRLALALAQDVPVWVLDEPLAGIDPESREAIGLVLARYLAGAPRTVLMATHEIDEVEALVDRVLVLDGGGIRLDASPEDLRQRSGGSVETFMRRGGWR